ncbi:uncharacterized protein LOC133799803 [Humulus lupulus]|uniref:uncharacterized protein LOC133799803 n=1 Tax=Humulus lupulus TaxID=3486 RepID=UPI002B40D2E3|nr:uncharacterized protein LOC133799803 [Humulus lupulus]
MLKLVDNFSAFNQRLKYAHFRPHVSMKSDPRSWWKYAYRVVSDQVKKGRLNQKIVLSILCLGKELYIDTASHVSVVFASTANQGIHLFPRMLTTRRKRNLRRWKIRCLDGSQILVLQILVHIGLQVNFSLISAELLQFELPFGLH